MFSCFMYFSYIFFFYLFSFFYPIAFVRQTKQSTLNKTAFLNGLVDFFINI